MGATSGRCPGRSCAERARLVPPNGRMIVFSGGTGQPGYSGLSDCERGQRTPDAPHLGHVVRRCAGLVAGNGTRIAFGSNRDGTEQIWTLRLRTHRLHAAEPFRSDGLR